MSDNPFVQRNPDTSHQADIETVQSTSVGRRRMVTALLHGRSQSGADRRRQWPLLLAGMVATGLVAAGMGIASAYQDQKTLDGQKEPAAPVETTEPTVTPTSPAPSSAPTSPPTSTKPATPPASKQPAPPQQSNRPPKQAPKQPDDTSGPTKNGPTKNGPAKGDDRNGAAKGDTTPKNDRPKRR